ncbi:mechanosensitive ion channel protein 10-like [Tasmannia lanceolata]|uniref:mechanosensitive ion channel protein 10-like n=1 Tax=Tasmannia lanceolata TaxID=3420 RepID=UPI004062AE81
MQNPEKGKPSPDQVILNLDPQQKPKPLDRFDSNTSEAKTPNTSKPRPIRQPTFKPKSRFLELNNPLPQKPTPVSEEPSSDPQKTQFSDNEADEELLKEETIPEKYRTKKKKIRWRAIVESIAFIVITSCLVSSLTVSYLKEKIIWGLELWKWCLMILVTFCGRLVSDWLVWVLVFLIERNYMLREKVVYFVYGLRRSVQNCVWLALVLLAWTLMFNSEVETSNPMHMRLLNKVSRALLAILIGAIIWLVKILLVKVLASSFHVATFFDRMKESVFHHYILEALSGPAPDEVSQSPSRKEWNRSFTMPSRLCEYNRQSRRKDGGVGTGSRRVDMAQLNWLSRARPTAWTVKRLVSHVRKSGLSTISQTVDETMERFRETESEITSEYEARLAAQKIFLNVAKPGEKYIDENDLLRFFYQDEVNTILPLFQGALETGKIRKSALRNWVVRAYIERKALAHALNDTKTAVQQLHKLASAVVIIIIIIMSLMVMGVATSKVLVLVTSQLLLVGFIFQNTCKTIFESVVFVFVMHPFDVGDRCVIDGVQMIVEEMNILTTVFLRYDNEKIYYPNSVLLTKAISNFYRSPEMGDTIEFSIDVSTSPENFTALKKSIQAYVEGKPKHWQSKHSVVVKEIEDVNKMKIALYVLHTINYQNFPERNNRRSDLLFELKKIFENLGIKYHLLPQEVHLSHVSMANARVPPMA